MADSHIFADAFNYLIYNGEQVIHPEDLHTLDTTAIAVPYGADGVGVPVQKYRDELKYLNVKTDESSVYLILGIENQIYIMPCLFGIWYMMHFSMQNRSIKPLQTIEETNIKNQQAENIGHQVST